MKNNVYPCKPQFYYTQVEFKGVKLYRRVCFRDVNIFAGRHETPTENTCVCVCLCYLSFFVASFLITWYHPYIDE